MLKVLAFAKQTFEMKLFLAAADGTSCFESLQKCQKAQELCSWCSALDPSAFDFWKRSRRFRVYLGKAKLSVVTSFKREKKSVSNLLKVLAFAKQTFEPKLFLAAADGASCFESLEKCQKAQEICSWCSALDPSAFDFWKRSRRFRVYPGKVKLPVVTLLKENVKSSCFCKTNFWNETFSLQLLMAHHVSKVWKSVRKRKNFVLGGSALDPSAFDFWKRSRRFRVYLGKAKLSVVTSFKREKKSVSNLLKVLAFAKQTFETKLFLAAADGASCFESLEKCQKAQEICSWCSALDPSAFDFWKRSRRFRVYLGKVKLSVVTSFKREKKSVSNLLKVLAFAKQTFETKLFLAAADGASCFESLEKCQKAQEICSWCSALDPSAFDFWKRSRRFRVYLGKVKLSVVTSFKREKKSVSNLLKVLAFAKQTFEPKLFLAAADGASCFESLEKCQKAQEICSWCSALDPSAFDFWKRSRRFRVYPGKVKLPVVTLLKENVKSSCFCKTNFWNETFSLQLLMAHHVSKVWKSVRKRKNFVLGAALWIRALSDFWKRSRRFRVYLGKVKLSVVTSFKREKKSVSNLWKVLAFAKQTFETKLFLAAADGASCFESLQKLRKAQELCSWCSALDPSAFDFWKRSRRFRVYLGQVKLSVVTPFKREKKSVSNLLKVLAFAKQTFEMKLFLAAADWRIMFRKFAKVSESARNLFLVQRFGSERFRFLKTFSEI